MSQLVYSSNAHLAARAAVVFGAEERELLAAQLAHGGRVGAHQSRRHAAQVRHRERPVAARLRAHSTPLVTYSCTNLSNSPELNVLNAALSGDAPACSGNRS